VARRFGATHLLLPAPRPALARYDADELTDERFRFVASMPSSSYRLYRVEGSGVAGAEGRTAP
jgi:hypothetical protein